MRNRKLYESVESLVKERQKKKVCKRTFVEQFCRKQMERKKLIPKDKNSKIDNIMSKFKGIHTYIDVDQLIDCINQIHSQEIKNSHSEAPELKILKNKIGKLEKHKRFASEANQEGKKVLQRSQAILKDHYLKNLQSEENTVKGFIGMLQKNSTYIGDQKKNSSFDVLGKISKRNKFQQSTISKDQDGKENWNYYQNAAEQWQYIKKLGGQSKEKTCWVKQPHSGDLCKKRKKMFKLARIYLHMILEDEHRKKWNPKDNSNDQFFSSTKRNEYLKRFSPFQKQKIPQKKKSIFSLSKLSSKKNSILLGDLEGQLFRPNKKKKESNHIYEREVAIKKLTNFLQDLEEDEKILIKEKRIDIEELQRFANRLHDDIETTHMITWGDQQKINEIKNALSRQDSKPRRLISRRK